jgi:hypothetical protein
LPRVGATAAQTGAPDYPLVCGDYADMRGRRTGCSGCPHYGGASDDDCHPDNDEGAGRRPPPPIFGWLCPMRARGPDRDHQLAANLHRFFAVAK